MCLNKDDCFFAIFEDGLIFADATVTDLAVDASPDQASVVFVDLDFVVLVDVLVNVTDLAVAASSDAATVVFVDFKLKL